MKARFVPATSVRWWTRACLWTLVATLAVLVIPAAVHTPHAAFVAIEAVGFVSLTGGERQSNPWAACSIETPRQGGAAWCWVVACAKVVN